MGGRGLKASFSAGPRKGLSDFVPKESGVVTFLTAYHPMLRRCRHALRRAGVETLLDDSRLMALIDLVKFAAQTSDGELIELGVYKGGSAAATAWTLRETGLQRPLHLCDTFEGMPKTLDWEMHEQHDFGDTSEQVVREKLGKLVPEFPIEFHKGLFSDTLPLISDRRFCFAHIDADLYESVRRACEFVYPRMGQGAILLFDDYGASTCPGAKKAVDEFFADKVEKPTHVASTAYGIRIGSRVTDFQKLINHRVLPRALFHGVYRFPLRVGARSVLRISERMGSPNITRIVVNPFLRHVERQVKAAADVSRARRILLIRLDTIGDLVLFSPFLRELRNSNPSAQISLVVHPEFANLVELCPYVNDILMFDHRYGGRFGKLEMHARALLFAKSRLWPKKLDLALLPRWGPDFYHSTFLAYFSGAAARVGFSEKVEPEKRQINHGFDSLLTWAIDDRRTVHEVEHNLDFLRAIGGSVRDEHLELWLSDADQAFAHAALQSHGVLWSDSIIAIAPGAGSPKRIWRMSGFVQLARSLVQESGVRILIVGGLRDRDRAARLKEEVGAAAVNLAGKATIRQTAALLQRAALLVSNDSGPMHLAAAVGVPVVEISCHPANGDPNHANSPARFHPWVADYAVVQPLSAMKPCLRACEWHDAHCILGISVERVLEAVRGLQLATAKKTSGAAGDCHG